MLLRRLYDDGLAQASYLLGCQATGEALVVDPNRDADRYLEAAREERVRITAVTETHIHADFLSGSRELVARTGAQLLLSGEGGPDWQYRFAREDGARVLRDGDHFMIGNIRVDVMHTPGHTPEHLSFVVTDTPATSRPVGIFTGDFVFVGDVGRPDLLERAAGMAGTMEAGARTLFRSLQRFRALPDHLQVWPGHGAGSACGKALGAMPASTVGYEKIANWGVSTTDEQAFVREVLQGQPEPPRYFAVMKRLNRDGPAILGAVPQPARQDDALLATLVRSGGIVADVRLGEAFARGHVPNTVSLPINKSFLTWSGALLPYDRDIYLIVDDETGAGAANAVRQLALIGVDRVAGWFGPRALDSWRAAGGQLQRLPQMAVEELATRDDVTVIDVRARSEWDAGHLPGGVQHIPLAELPDRMAEIPKGAPIVMQCQGGSRSAIAASLLLANGFEDVHNLAGGFGAWERAGLPVESPAAEAAAPASR